MAKKYLGLSETLKKLLFERDMKPTELARELDIPQPTIHRLVTGKSTRPYKSSLEPIAEYFNVTVDQLLGEETLLPSELKELKATQLGKNIRVIPLVSWQSLGVEDKKVVAESEIVVGNMSEHAFAVILPDYSMEPAFQKGSTLIFDPKIEPTDRSYVLVKLKSSNTYVFRQILIDADQKFIKCLNPEISAASMRLLNQDDEIVACLVEARNSFQFAQSILK